MAKPTKSEKATPKRKGKAPFLRLVEGEALSYLESLESDSFPMIYVDPPFNTGKRQELHRTRTSRDTDGDRVGFKGQRYRTETVSKMGYLDSYSDYMAFLGPHLEQAIRVMSPSGSLFVHLDAREVHYAKVFLDGLLGRDRFMNEIIWAYDFGGRSRSKWSSKHDSILWYVKDPKNYTFRFEDMDRIPYMAPGLVGPKKASRGKTPTDVWWNTIVSTVGKERTGYPNQKPRAILSIGWCAFTLIPAIRFSIFLRVAERREQPLGSSAVRRSSSTKTPRRSES